MPKNAQGHVFCLNGTNNPEHQMLSSKESYALTEVLKKDDGSILFKPDSGIPMKAIYATLVDILRYITILNFHLYFEKKTKAIPT